MQHRLQARRAQIEAYETSLAQVSQRARPAPDFLQAIADAGHGFEGEFLRDPAAWKPQMKSRDPGRLRLAAARHLFARYPVADHLERIWIDTGGLAHEEIALRKRWYVVAAGGGSLWRAGAQAWLSRKEIHAFLNPPGRLAFDEAIWHAIARTYARTPGDALRIARSRIAATPRAELAFWREVARFFCVHAATVEEMDDLGDYLADCRARDPAFSLKGRTLASLGRQMRAWHRDLAAIERIEAARRRAEIARARANGTPLPAPTSGAAWPGAPIMDWSWSPSTKVRAKREEFMVVQLRTAAELVAETRIMRHCVAGYATKCIAGHTSIWSLRRRWAGATERLLTIELDRSNVAIQVRGFSNRLANAEERKILERWAKARSIALR